MARNIPFILLLGLIALTSAAANSQDGTKFYKHVDKDGHVSYTDNPQHDGYIELKLRQKKWNTTGTYADYKANMRKYKPLIETKSAKHGLPHWLISAIIHAESLYNYQAISHAGAVGLMQLMPGTAARYGVHNRQDPEQNVDAGARYLNDLLAMFDNNLDLALAAYNAGENAVKKYGNRIPPYKETRNYVRKVKALSLRYKSRPI